jgi:hypothetical protein
LLDVPLFAIAKAPIVFDVTLPMNQATVAAVKFWPVGLRLIASKR